MVAYVRGCWIAVLVPVALASALSCKEAHTSGPPAPLSAPPPSVAGTILRVVSRTERVPVAGAQVCVEDTTNCATSAADGGYALGGIALAPVFLSASADGFLPTETRQAIVLAAGEARTGVDLVLSGRPSAQATYVGRGLCYYCHAEESMAWQASAHFQALDRTTGHVDVTGWPAAPATCAAPATADSGVTGADPVSGQDREVWLVRWRAGCGAGKPAFAMAFDADQDDAVDAGDTIVPVTGSVGGVATGAGQCGNGGLMPPGTDCAANLGGSAATKAMGWWQQEYLTAIGGAAKPAWVSWDTGGTPDDLLVMPLAWNQRAGQWVAAPDYDTAQDGTWSKACAGCHEVGLTLAADAGGLVTQYAAASAELGCEKCHGPASEHVRRLDPRYIINPRWLTAQAEREVCAQCHSQGVASASPAGAFGFAWNDQAAMGGGNFIPGVHQLSDFMTAPAFGDPEFYWTAGFPAFDHLTAVDVAASAHATNPSEKVTCGDCHSGHAGAGGPVAVARTDGATGDAYRFLDNDAALRDGVVCLACHVGRGSFATLALSDAAAFHLSAGGAAEKNGAAWTVSAADQIAAATLVATTVQAHMLAKSACTAPFDPEGAQGVPGGRCGTCHMAKTAFTGTYFSGVDGGGRTANVMGDVTSHTFKVATPAQSQATLLAGATTWDAVMPNGCGACHAADRYGP